jgi:hypothetical protein
MGVSVLKDHSNAAAFVSSKKVRIFRSDRRNSDRHGGTVLGFNAHLKIQLVEQSKRCRGLFKGMANTPSMTNRNREFRQNSAHLLVGALRQTYGPSFAAGCADNERLKGLNKLKQMISKYEEILKLMQ